MIIHPDHEFAFVEVPRTGTTAISKELRDNYGCIDIVRKHATFEEATREHPDLAGYTVIAGKRNPLDAEVSMYFKYKNNHKGSYTMPERWQRNGGWVSDLALERFEFIRSTEATFADYFARYGTAVRSTEWRQDQRRAAYLVPFEDLQRGFSRLLSVAGLDQQRPLPEVNVTKGRDKDFRIHYTPEIRDRAVAVFGPMMAELGYAFPDDWHVSDPPLLSRIAYLADRFSFRRPAGVLRRLAVRKGT